jgi:hypothetical protein
VTTGNVATAVSTGNVATVVSTGNVATVVSTGNVVSVVVTSRLTTAPTPTTAAHRGALAPDVRLSANDNDGPRQQTLRYPCRRAV